jgi:hypothetical protein
VEINFHMSHFYSKSAKQIETLSRLDISFIMCIVSESSSKQEILREMYYHNVVPETSQGA